MTTLQCDRTLSFTFNRFPMFHLFSDPTFNFLGVATLQCDFNQFRTPCSTFLATESVACMPTVQLFLARFLADKLTIWTRTWHHLQVTTL